MDDVRKEALAMLAAWRLTDYALVKRLYRNGAISLGNGEIPGLTIQLADAIVDMLDTNLRCVKLEKDYDGVLWRASIGGGNSWMHECPAHAILFSAWHASVGKLKPLTTEEETYA